MSEYDSQKNDETPHCSFCGKTQNEVFALLVGPSVFICNECVSDCMSIIEEKRNEVETGVSRIKNGLSFDVTKERIKKIEKKALSKLKKDNGNDTGS